MKKILETLSAFLSQAVNIPGLYESEKNKKNFGPPKNTKKRIIKILILPKNTKKHF